MPHSLHLPWIQSPDRERRVLQITPPHTLVARNPPSDCETHKLGHIPAPKYAEYAEHVRAS